MATLPACWATRWRCPDEEAVLGRGGELGDDPDVVESDGVQLVGAWVVSGWAGSPWPPLPARRPGLPCPPGSLPSYPGVVADAMVALQFRYNKTVSVTAPNLSPLNGAFSECVTMHLSFGNETPFGLL